MSTSSQTVTVNTEKVKIFDTTLRDGEQSPGCSMNLEEKLKVAAVLEELNVDIIEAGFPIASNGDFEAVAAIAKQAQKATIAGLARASKKDIDRAWEAVKHAKSSRIHTFLSTSPLHMKFKLQKEPDVVHQMVVDSVTHARNLCDDVEWSAEDGSRTEHEFLCRCVESAIKAGATTINIPDTVGYAVPEEYAALIEMLFNKVPNIDKATISVHCHNDLGLAVANSLAAVEAGARQIECTINGIGERAGNASLEEIVMAMQVRGDVMPYHTDLDATVITKASRTLSGVTGFTVQPNKAIVGANAFAHESVIHQDGMLKNAETYEIMTPASVGLVESNLVLGKHSGRAAFKNKLAELGFDDLGANSLDDAFVRFKDLADHKKEVFDEDLIALVDDSALRQNDHIKFKSVQIVCGSEGPQTADLTITIDGEEKRCKSEGNGPVDAIFKAIKEMVPQNARMQLYQVHAVTGGTDAQAEVTVRLEEDGKTVNGQGADHDTLVASARAYINALNKLIVKREKTAPEAMTA